MPQSTASRCLILLVLLWVAKLDLGMLLAQDLPSQLASRFDSADEPTNRKLFRASYENESALQTIEGELVASDRDLGHLILDADGHLTAIPPDKLKRIDEIGGGLATTSAKDIAAKVLKLMPAGSKSLMTDHFVICYNTSDVYARWNGRLYESLYKGFFKFWKDKGIELKPPRFPMVALVFETKNDYVTYASKEFEGAEHTIGYYHQSTNRLASYDLTGIEGMLPPGAPVFRDELISQILIRPQAERLVATIIHEACHQISFNCGLQTRLGENPLWLSEGLATFFESPDGSSTIGWSGPGKVNRHNFVNLSRYFPQRPADSLQRLLTDDNRFRSAEASASAYAEAWALTYHLLRNKPKQFVTYLKRLQEKPPGSSSSPKDRVELFQECFGEDLVKFDKEFVRYMQAQKLR